jgi:putative copper resistance protein D
MNGIALSQMDWPSIELVLTATQWGLAIAIRSGLAALACGLALAMRPSRPLWAGVAALGLLILASFAWTGHGAASVGPWAWIHLVSDIVHAVAAGVWIGSLACFLMLILKPARTNEEDLAVYAALHGFAGTGSLVVSALVVTGIVNTMFIVDAEQLPALLTSSFGWVLGVKLLAFAGMVAFAAVNRLKLTPALKLSLDSGQSAKALAGLRSSLLVETALGFGVLFLVGVLGLMAPPVGL